MLPSPDLLSILVTTCALAFTSNARDIVSKAGRSAHELHPRIFTGESSEGSDHRPGYGAPAMPEPFRQNPNAGSSHELYVTPDQLTNLRKTPPMYNIAPKTEDWIHQELEGSLEDMKGLWSLLIEGTGPLSFFVEDGLLYEQIAYSGNKGGSSCLFSICLPYYAEQLMYSPGTESEPQVYKPFTGQEEKRTAYGKARSEAYFEMNPQVRDNLDHTISMQLRSLRREQSLANGATWNRAHQQIPSTQFQPVDGVTYDFGSDLATSQQEHNAQWGLAPVYIPPAGWITTHADVQNFFKPARESLQKRQGVLDNIDASVSKENSTAAQTAEFQLYLNAYRTVQANISDSLFPFFDAVLNGTNSSLIYDIVWSVYSDLTGLGPQIIGPFSYGMHCFDWMEEAYLNSTRNTANNTSGHTSSVTSTNSTNAQDPVYQQMLATHYTLIEFYGYVWTNASAIANQTGLLRDLVVLSEYLTPVDASLMSADWTSVQSQFDDSYFTAYNKTH